MKKIACLMNEIGHVDDHYFIPFVKRYNLPLFVKKPCKPNTFRKFKRKGINIISKNIGFDKSSNFFKWLKDKLDMMGIKVLISSYYPSSLHSMSNFREFLQNIYLISIPHGGDDRNRLDIESYNTFSVFAKFDLVLLDNNYWADLIKKISTRNINFKVIGNIHLSLFLKNDMFRFEDLKPKYYRNNRIDVNRKTILYAPTWYSKRQDILGNGYFERCGIQICRNVPFNINLIVKPHPQSLVTSNEYINKFKLAFKNRKYFVFIEQNIDILPLILYSDVIISDHSVVCLLSLAMNKNLIIYDPVKNPIFYDFVVRHCDYAKHINSLKKFIKLNLNDPLRNENLRQRFIKESRIINPNVIEDAWDIISKSIKKI